jgi:hypothetical protein
MSPVHTQCHTPQWQQQNCKFSDEITTQVVVWHYSALRNNSSQGIHRHYHTTCGNSKNNSSQGIHKCHQLPTTAHKAYTKCHRMSLPTTLHGEFATFILARSSVYPPASKFQILAWASCDNDKISDKARGRSSDNQTQRVIRPPIVASADNNRWSGISKEPP